MTLAPRLGNNLTGTALAYILIGTNREFRASKRTDLYSPQLRSPARRDVLQVRRSRVAIVKGKDPSKMLRKAIDILGLEDLCVAGKDVLIKPNCESAKPASSGITTDSRLVEALVVRAKKAAASVTVAEGSSGNTERAFDVAGISEIAKRLGVSLVDLNEDEPVMVEIADGMALKEVRIASTALRCSSIINVPKLKVHSAALVSLCMENLMTFLLPRAMVQTRIDERIVDLAGFFRDKVKLNVVDGLIGAEVNEAYGEPVNMGLQIVGRDMVAVDAVGASVMGMDPMDVGHIRLAEERGLGAAKLANIEVLGEKIENVARPFEKPPKFRSLR